MNKLFSGKTAAATGESSSLRDQIFNNQPAFIPAGIQYLSYEDYIPLAAHIHYLTFLQIRFPPNLTKGSWVLNQVKEIDVKLVQNADICNFTEEYLKNKKNSF